VDSSNPPVLTNTPVERHGDVWVKREDLCCPLPGPGFSKVRGLLAHMEASQAERFGALDTSTSKAGWGLAYLAAWLRRRAVVFYPGMKAWNGEPGLYQQRAAEFGAELIPMKPGRSNVLWHQARRQLAVSDPRAEMLPNGLRLAETVTETAAELMRTPPDVLGGTLVVNVGSGTICSGVLAGLLSSGRRVERMVGVTTHRLSPAVKRRQIWNKMVGETGPLTRMPDWFNLVVTDYGYSDREDEPCPFPCNPWYDRKAWRWLVEHRKGLPEPVLFWNIGS